MKKTNVHKSAQNAHFGGHMKKGKSRTRTARIDIMKRNAASARRKARTQAKIYDKQRYDGSEGVGGNG
jgi:predicted DNA-binding protein with PD1-like motif